MKDSVKAEVIKTLRKEIDRIDEDIIDLLEKRVEVAKKIIKNKRKLGKNKHSPDRENELLSRLTEYSNLPESFVRKLYDEILVMVKTLVK